MLDTISEKAVIEIRKKYCARFDAEEGETKEKKHSAGATRLPYGLLKGIGVSSEGLTPKQAWDKYRHYTGISPEEAYDAHFKGGPAPVELPLVRYFRVKPWYYSKLIKEYGKKPKKITENMDSAFTKATLCAIEFDDGSTKLKWIPKSVLEDLKVYAWKDKKS